MVPETTMNWIERKTPVGNNPTGIFLVYNKSYRCS
jgi:hypothetical protein